MDDRVLKEYSIAIQGKIRTGKTTYLNKLIKELRQLGNDIVYIEAHVPYYKIEGNLSNYSEQLRNGNHNIKELFKCINNEIQRRIKIMSNLGCNTIKDVRKLGINLPDITIAIDEFDRLANNTKTLLTIIDNILLHSKITGIRLIIVTFQIDGLYNSVDLRVTTSRDIKGNFKTELS